MTAPGRTSSSALFCGSAFAIRDWRCEPTSGEMGPEEACDAACIVVVRRGVFRRHVGPETTVADPNTALLFNPHEPYRVSHPLAIGDRCAVIMLHRPALQHLAESFRLGEGWTAERPFRATHTRISARSMLRLRVATDRAAPRDDLATEETVTEIVAEAIEGQPGSVASRPLPPPKLCHRAVERVREIAAVRFRQPLSLRLFSEATGYSPFYLLRAFRAETGLPIRRYVNRLRLLHALDGLEPGCNLSRLAHELGYSSHSHFTRAFAAEFGVPPARVRGAHPVPGAA